MIHDGRPPRGLGSDRGRALQAWTRALVRTAPITRNPTVTFPIVIENLARERGDAPALLSDREYLTYGALADRSNRYARWALAQGVGAGVVVGLLMTNCPEYMAIWLGVTRVGGIVSLINTKLVDDSLSRSINSVAPIHLIVGADLFSSLVGVFPRLHPSVRIWVHGEGDHGLPRIDWDVDHRAGDRLDNSACAAPSLSDRALYIHTSGTTGLPKAAIVSHFRLMQWTHWFAGMMDTRPSDRMYNCLPMYHSIGGVVAIGATLVGGGSVLIRQLFSASRFWDDVIAGECTLFQYIGELCWYLVHSPPHPRETEHRIRLCCGNGLRWDIWGAFQQRFRIPQILEYYAATEGSFSLYNCDGKRGAIGRIPTFLAHRFSVALIKVDAETGMPIRNDAGFCIRCCANEVGEAIGPLSDGGRNLVGRFEGYTDAAATERKVLRGVFIDGDAWYRSGDLMRRDETGYFYFVDRLGDTFRWKGENVSTAEVAEAIAACPGVVEALVYGVSVPGTEGRAGMAAMVVDQDFHLRAFRKHLEESLANYARPLFLRLCRRFETTATFRPRKQELASEGYDPAVVLDPLFFDDPARKAFVTLDPRLYGRIASGSVRL